MAAQLEPLCRRAKRALACGKAQTQCERTAKTCEMIKLWPALWTFLRDPAVPPTNNEAERALRALVLKRKISSPPSLLPNLTPSGQLPTQVAGHFGRHHRIAPLLARLYVPPEYVQSEVDLRATE
jgi:hypothetical protein